MMKLNERKKTMEDWYVHGDERARESLILDNIEMVENFIKKHLNVPEQEYEDVLSDGILIMEKAISSYKLSYRQSLSDHILTELSMGFKKLYPQYYFGIETKEKPNIILDNESDEGVWEDEILDELETAEQKELLSQALLRLRPKMRDFFCYRTGYPDGEKKTLAEMAEVFGCSRERIRQIYVRSQNLIRKHIQNIIEEKTEQLKREQQANKRNQNAGETGACDGEEYDKLEQHVQKRNMLWENLKKYKKDDDMLARKALIDEFRDIVEDCLKEYDWPSEDTCQEAREAGIKTIENRIDKKTEKDPALLRKLLYRIVREDIEKVLLKDEEKESQ